MTSAPKGHCHESGNPLAVHGCRVKPGMTCRRGLRLWTIAFWRQLLTETLQEGVATYQVRSVTYGDEK